MTKKERATMNYELKQVLERHGEHGACKLVEVWVMQLKYPVLDMLQALVNLSCIRRAQNKQKKGE